MQEFEKVDRGTGKIHKEFETFELQSPTEQGLITNCFRIEPLVGVCRRQN